jgi:hypothetical protein
MDLWLKFRIIHTSHQNNISKKLKLYILCHFYILKPTNFAQTHCFTIFAQILLKFHDIEIKLRKRKDRFCDELYKYICIIILFIKFLEINYASHFMIISIIKK